MYQQIQQQFLSLTRQVTEAGLKANRLALENAERAIGAQLSVAENNYNSSVAWFGAASQIRDFEQLSELMPKGVEIARENAERTVSVNQEILASAGKAQEAIVTLLRAPFEANFAETKPAAAKTTRK